MTLKIRSLGVFSCLPPPGIPSFSPTMMKTIAFLFSTCFAFACYLKLVFLSPILLSVLSKKFHCSSRDNSHAPYPESPQLHNENPKLFRLDFSEYQKDIFSPALF